MCVAFLKTPPPAGDCVMIGYRLSRDRILMFAKFAERSSSISSPSIFGFVKKKRK